MNADQRVIVLCDWDERIAAPAANLLFEKGADNVVLLSGGQCTCFSASSSIECLATTLMLLVMQGIFRMHFPHILHDRCA